MSKFKLKRWQRILLIVLAVIVIVPVVLFIILGLLPADGDPVLAMESVIVGAQHAADGGSSVDTAFPEMKIPTGSGGNTPEKQELGKLLFFDPILSADKSMSCATCHHPDLGFTDGRMTAQGLNDVALKRNVPTLYEVGYKAALMWDGRAESLETQMTIPLTSSDEMANNEAQLVTALTAIPDYVDLFARAFPDSSEPITLQNVGYALASFERTLVAHNSPFDRYAAGDFSALTPSQRRGFALFRSGATGCYKCHFAPTFTNGQFEITGVPGADGKLDDSGRGGITSVTTDNYAFMTPTLRNIALTAPYMHNGSMTTLEQVLDFYIKGGGAGMGIEVPDQARFVHSFELSDQEKQDLISFLYALTDESSKPAIPSSVPSGLPVVEAKDNPGRELALAANAGGVAVTARAPMTLTVTPDVTIQSVVDQAQNGDTIEIAYGTYSERVTIDQSDITVRGIPNAAGEYPVLDGKMGFSDGIAASGDNFTIEKLAVKNYKGNGIIVDGAVGVIIRDIYVENTSLYGVYPVHSTNVLVERVEATLIRDAGVYVGQSQDVIIRDNKAWANVIGIEIENSVNAEVYNNHTYDNSTGIFVDLLPQLPSKVSRFTKVHDNIIENNNHHNFANEGVIGALVPEGTGILVLGGDDVEIYNNTIKDNRTVGVAIFSTATAFAPEMIDIGPNPERIYVHSNTFANNGYDAASQLTDLGISGQDIVWDASSWDLKFDQPGASSFPPILPSSSWADLSRKGYWQIVHFVISKLG
ncbi:MAG: parallel beta-helix domain-containing protein [Anaerolineae bacterium]